MKTILEKLTEEFEFYGDEQMSAKSALESIKNAFVESESQTIKTVNPHGYIVNNTFSKCEYYIGFEDMKGRTMTGQDEVTPLYTMQLTDK